jgi:CRP-like cAMP-binding protein
MENLLLVSALGLITTSSSIVGVALGLYVYLSKGLLAGVLAFAAGALIGALAIDLAFKGALELHHLGFEAASAWAFMAGGFFAGAVFYYVASLFIDNEGGAVRTPARFEEYVLKQKRAESKAMIALLSKSDLMCHLPPEAIEALIARVRTRRFEPGAVVFRAGDPGEALYIVARGAVEVVEDGAGATAAPIAALGPGSAFGEMALLSGEPRTATVRARGAAELLEIGKEDFQALVASDPALARAAQRLSHERAITNLRSGGKRPATWARIAQNSMDTVTRAEADKALKEVGRGAGLAIILGNVLDTIPGCLVIGASFSGIANLSLTLMLGMFLGGIPEAAASAALLKKADYRPKMIFGLWSSVLVAGVVAAAAGRLFIGSAESLVAIFCEAVAGGAVLALVAHAMIPEAIHDGGSRIVLPTVAGFLVALYLALETALV